MKITLDESDLKNLPGNVRDGLLHYVKTFGAEQISGSKKDVEKCDLCDSPVDVERIEQLAIQLRPELPLRKYNVCKSHSLAIGSGNLTLGEISLEAAFTLLAGLNGASKSALKVISNNWDKAARTGKLSNLTPSSDVATSTKAFNGIASGITRKVRGLTKNGKFDAIGSQIRLIWVVPRSFLGDFMRLDEGIQSEYYIIVHPVVARAVLGILSGVFNEKINMEAIQAYKAGRGLLRFYSDSKQHKIKPKFSNFTSSASVATLYCDAEEHFVDEEGKIIRSPHKK